MSGKKRISNVDQIQIVATYYRRIRAEPYSMFVGRVTQKIDGYDKTVCEIQFDRTGNIEVSNKEVSSKTYEPTDAERDAIKIAFQDFEFPKHFPLAALINPPKEFEQASEEDKFVYKTAYGRIAMLEVRVDHDNGHKEYIPFIYMSDGHWYRQRPETGNPIYNLEKARDNLVVYIHEGAKAARKAQELIEGSSRKVQTDHPWYQFLRGGVHIGWSGGAYDEHNTDWAQLKRMGVEKAIIIADNDLVGMRAALQISKRLQMDTRIVQFTDEFPACFDLGDEFPDDMFKPMPENSKPGGPTRKYIGPSYFDCLHPGTWATDRIKGKDDKTRTILRRHFMDYIRYVEEAEVFVHTDFPQLRESEKAFNARMTAHSHTDKLSKLVLRERTTRIENACLSPRCQRTTDHSRRHLCIQHLSPAGH
ncbi:MAG: hypothetical protein CSA72_02830 [Rhodobacterales bacterium]|nr:MAG: hypothetical protein CSA72_02830 [Rhodobacterales bacterium]